MKNTNRIVRKTKATIATVAAVTAVAASATTLLAPASASAATTSSTSTLSTSTLSTSTLSTSTMASKLSAAVKWMNANGQAKLPFWTQVAVYAGSGTYANATFKGTDFSKLTASTDYAKAILGVLASGQDPHAIAGFNLVSKLASTQITSGTNEGKFADNLDGTGTDLINGQVYAIIALEDAGGATYNRVSAANWLLSKQNKDGGFGYSSQYSSSDPDDTAGAIVALRLLGFNQDSTAVAAGLKYLQSQQADDGGFMNGSTSGNSDSTGVTIDALASLGLNPAAWQAKSGNPVTSLLSLSDPASGGFKYDNSGSSWSGVSALSTRDGIFGLAAAMDKKSVYQRLHWTHLNWLNAYWTHVYKVGGTDVQGKWYSWGQLRPMALAGTYLSDLTPKWQSVIAHHGMYETVNGKQVWTAWGPTLAPQALGDSFGLDTLHLNLIAEPAASAR